MKIFKQFKFIVNSQLIDAWFTLLSFPMKTEQSSSVFTLDSHCSAVKTELFVDANENSYLKTIRFYFECQTQKYLESLHIHLLIGC